MIPLYNPKLLELYMFDIQNFSFPDGMVLLGVVIAFMIYLLLEKIILPKHYLNIQKQMAKDDVKKSLLKREYIEKCEKII